MCGRRFGFLERRVDVEGSDVVHPACASALLEDASTRRIDDLLDEWRSLAYVLEADEPFSTDDLTLALATRDVLEEQRARLTQSEAEELDRIDARYRAATRPDEDDVLATLWPHSGGWWWLRVPARGEAGAYFDREGEDLRRSRPDIANPS